ncbi:hypothetical protein L1049_021680 [Liquidambar formosana]|uniref:Uncharacterized protein n=1 Tax=Liquidambar formosana TaxID=63359 RepID=A0AAP0WP67_LIQFO
MNVLDSQLEALAFSYLSFGLLTIVNNLWTWVAVITAAVSFWRLKAAGSPKSVPQGPILDQNTTGSEPASASASASPPCDSTEEEPAVAPPSTSASISGVTAAVRADIDEEVTKGKFTVYYEDDRESDGDMVVDGEWEGCDGAEGLGEGCGEWSDGWERMMRVRMGDLGWYRFQDTTVLDGSVVRLWDGSRRWIPVSECVMW